MPQLRLSGIGVETGDILFATGWYGVTPAAIRTFCSVPLRMVWM
jgi:hypothetical protein